MFLTKTIMHMSNFHHAAVLHRSAAMQIFKVKFIPVIRHLFEIQLVSTCNDKGCTAPPNSATPMQAVRRRSSGSGGTPRQFAFSKAEQCSTDGKNTLKYVSYISFILNILDNHTNVSVFALFSNQ